VRGVDYSLHCSHFFFQERLLRPNRQFAQSRERYFQGEFTHYAIPAASCNGVFYPKSPPSGRLLPVTDRGLVVGRQRRFHTSPGPTPVFKVSPDPFGGRCDFTSSPASRPSRETTKGGAYELRLRGRARSPSGPRPPAENFALALVSGTQKSLGLRYS